MRWKWKQKPMSGEKSFYVFWFELIKIDKERPARQMSTPLLKTVLKNRLVSKFWWVLKFRRFLWCFWLMKKWDGNTWRSEYLQDIRFMLDFKINSQFRNKVLINKGWGRSESWKARSQQPLKCVYHKNFGINYTESTVLNFVCYFVSWTVNSNRVMLVNTLQKVKALVIN